MKNQASTKTTPTIEPKTRPGVLRLEADQATFNGEPIQDRQNFMVFLRGAWVPVFVTHPTPRTPAIMTTLTQDKMEWVELGETGHPALA
jgi:hypothetical protein